jgi:hypothetical protein
VRVEVRNRSWSQSQSWGPSQSKFNSKSMSKRTKVSSLCPGQNLNQSWSQNDLKAQDHFQVEIKVKIEV